MESVEIVLGGQKVRAYCEGLAVPEAKALLVTVQDKARAGLVIKEGERIALGWTHLLLRPHEGALVLHEPNYATNPMIAWRADVTTSVLVHRDMLGCAHSKGVQPVFPRFMDQITVSHDWRSKSPLEMKRETSGWKFGEGSDRIRVYELIGSRPALLPYLALPAGTLLTVH